MYRLSILSLLLLLFYGCDTSSSSTSDSNLTRITGKISYERINPSHNNSSSLLNRDNITKEPSLGITVEAIDATGAVLSRTNTNDKGEYTFSQLPVNTSIKIRAYAKIFKKDQWSVKVIDNTNSDSIYVIEGRLVDSGESNSVRNLTAVSSNRISGPFAILDSVYKAMKLVYKVDNSVKLPELLINWSVNNIPSNGSLSDGQIGTSFFDGANSIYILGDKHSDTDEFDNHVVIHEWGHFLEKKLSRADNIGGQHGEGDNLYIRVAFGEGFGNAFSAIVTDDPIYFDTYGRNGQSGWNMNIETTKHVNPGWSSEASVQRILYDLYDSKDDGEDKLSLGFKPLYEVLTKEQKTSKAFTSIFSFISELKSKNSSDSNKIDAIVASEDIATITDIYGSDRNNNLQRGTLPLYEKISLGESINLCTTNFYGSPNKINNHKYIRLSIPSNDIYTIRVAKTHGSVADFNFELFNTAPFKFNFLAEGEGDENRDISLSKGEYLLDIYNVQYSSRACFDVSIN